MTVVPISRTDSEIWLSLRRELWPHPSDSEHRADMEQLLSDPQRFAQFISMDDTGEPLGFAESSIRHDYVNGTSTSPVAFLEGVYVEPDARRRGVARALIEAVSAWAETRGIAELASDADVSNTLSHEMHRALGFEETERVVYFRKAIRGGDDR